jgi:hypothetical protein
MGTVFKTKEVSMIRWIWNFIMKWGWDFNRNLRNEDDCMPTTLRGTKAARLIRASEDVDSEQGLNITVRNALGGKIITFRTYDHKTDRHNHRLYVIPEDHEFEKELGKLITLESMRM